MCVYVYMYIYINMHTHEYLCVYIYISSSSCRAASTDILSLSRHFSLSFIASGRSSGLHPVPSHSCCMYVRAGRPAFAWPYARVHRSTSLMSLSLLLQLCPACLVHLAWIVFVMGGRWPYSWCLVGCCCQDLFNIARNIHIYIYIYIYYIYIYIYIYICTRLDTWVCVHLYVSIYRFINMSQTIYAYILSVYTCLYADS